MPQRRRATSEFEQTQSEAGPRVLTLDSLVGGYNGYTSPDLLTPQFWAASSNVYAGQFGAIRRARWAPFFNSTATGFTANAKRIVSMYSFLDNNNPNWFAGTVVNRVLFDNNDNVSWPRWVVNNPLSTLGMFPVFQADKELEAWDNFIGGTSGQDFPFALSMLNGPWMRVRIGNAIYETNGSFRSKTVPGIGTRFLPMFMFWGLDAPDVSPSVALVAGSTATIQAAPTGAVRANNIVTITATAALPAGMVTGVYVGISGVTDTTFNTAAGAAVQITVTGVSTFTFVQVGPAATSGTGTVTLGITKTVGRSYQWAWEADINAETSAPSPASQFVKYTSQTGTIDLVQTGTVSVTNGSATVTGVGTSFTSAWIGRAIWIEGLASTGNYIASVSSPTSMLLQNAYVGANIAGARFQIYDPQVGNNADGTAFVKLYATGDGQPVYFLIGRNAFNAGATTALAAGLRFNDTANSEPPNPPFTSEITQIYNVPPPIGSFLQEYQSRILVYGVAANLQTFFYSNIEATVIGQPPECFSPLNTVTMPLGDGQLNGMANLPTGLIQWSNRQDMFKLTGLLSDNTIANSMQLGATIQRLPYKIGCASPYATAVTPLGAIWLSSDREVWLFTDHYAPKNIGKPVQDVLNRINGTRLGFAKMSFYKRGDRSWLALAVALDSSAFNNKLLLLDLDLLASNGQPSFFTFDLATNAPTWYQYDINCEGICTSYDANSTNHIFVGDVDLITDVDWQPSYFTISAEQSVPGSNKLHAFGNEDPHMVKTFEWMRALTNQIPKNLAAQGWAWSIDAFDDDAFVIGVNALTTNLIPGVDSNSNPLFLEYSPAKFKFGGVRPVKGRRFQIGTTFPSAPGFFELRGFQVAYTNVVGR